jgi:hypothetical protein
LKTKLKKDGKFLSKKSFTNPASDIGHPSLASVMKNALQHKAAGRF